VMLNGVNRRRKYMYSGKCIIAFIFLNVLKHRADLVTEYFHVKTARDKAKSNYMLWLMAN